MARLFEDYLAEIRGEAPRGYGDFLAVPTPRELRLIYDAGYKGLRSAKNEQYNMRGVRTLHEAIPWSKGISRGKICLPYLAALYYVPTWGGDEAQTTGSCTSHSLRYACTDFYLDGLMGETKVNPGDRLATENIYKDRGHSGQGSSCAQGARYVSKDGPGGILLRKRYESPSGQSVDLSHLNERWTLDGRSRVPAWLNEIASQNKARTVFEITDWEMECDANALGFGATVCAYWKCSSTCDEYGVAARQGGGWSHAMANIGCVRTPWAEKKYGGLSVNQQSWGRWNNQDGTRCPEGVPKVPTGSYCVRAKDEQARLGSGDNFVIADIDGFDRSAWDFLAARHKKVVRMAESAMDGDFVAV